MGGEAQGKGTQDPAETLLHWPGNRGRAPLGVPAAEGPPGPQEAPDF